MSGGRPLAFALLLMAATAIVYWCVWFLVPGGLEWLAGTPLDPAHVRFENAFPVADGWGALACTLAAVKLLRSDVRGALPWLYMAGSAGLYLAGMDILYDLENGIYLQLANPEKTGAVLAEIVINAGTVGISLWALAWAQRRWNTLLAS